MRYSIDCREFLESLYMLSCRFPEKYEQNASEFIREIIETLESDRTDELEFKLERICPTIVNPLEALEFLESRDDTLTEIEEKLTGIIGTETITDVSNAVDWLLENHLIVTGKQS